MAWLKEYWFVVLAGIAAVVILLRNARHPKGCCGDDRGTLEESRRSKVDER